MKFVANTISKPVVGREAKALSSALRKGSYVANQQALNTVARIAERRANQLNSNGENK